MCPRKTVGCMLKGGAAGRKGTQHSHGHALLAQEMDEVATYPRTMKDCKILILTDWSKVEVSSTLPARMIKLKKMLIMSKYLKQATTYARVHEGIIGKNTIINNPFGMNDHNFLLHIMKQARHAQMANGASCTRNERIIAAGQKLVGDCGKSHPLAGVSYPKTIKPWSDEEAPQLLMLCCGFFR